MANANQIMMQMAQTQSNLGMGIPQQMPEDWERSRKAVTANPNPPWTPGQVDLEAAREPPAGQRPLTQSMIAALTPMMPSNPRSQFTPGMAEGWANYMNAARQTAPAINAMPFVLDPQRLSTDRDANAAMIFPRSDRFNPLASLTEGIANTPEEQNALLEEVKKAQERLALMAQPVSLVNGTGG
jgi:hypothetical protein